LTPCPVPRIILREKLGRVFLYLDYNPPLETMKNLLLLFALLLTPQVVFAQDISGKLVASSSEMATWDTDVSSDRIEKLLLESVKKSNLRPFQKMRLNVILKTNIAPKLKQQLILDTTAKLLEAEKISEQEGEVVALVNWDEILAFIEKLLPLLIQLIGLFG